MRLLLIVFLGISLGGCGEEESIYQEKNSKSVDSLQQSGLEKAERHWTAREEVERNQEERSAERINMYPRSDPRQTFTDGGGTYVLGFSPNGRRLASGGGNGIVKIWELATGRVITEFDMLTIQHVTCVAFSPDGKTVAAASQRSKGGTIHVWDSETGDVRAIAGRTDTVRSLAFSSDGRMLAAGGTALSLWQISTEQEPVTLREQGSFCGVDFSPSGKWLAAAPGCYTDGPVAVEIWDVAARRLRARVRGHGLGHISSVAFSPDGNTLAIEGLTTAQLWDLFTLRETADRTITEFCEASPEFEIWGPGVKRVKMTSVRSHAQIASVAFSPDGKTLASWSVDKTVKLWDVMTGEELTTLTGQSPDLEFFCSHSVAFSPDEKTLAAASGNLIRLWELEDLPRSSPSQLRGAEKKATELGVGNGEPFSLDGLAYMSCAVYSPDGRMLAAGAIADDGFPRAGVVTVWDVATGRTLTTLPHPGEVRTVGGSSSGRDNSIQSLKFSPDGTNLVAATHLGVKVWEVVGGRELTKLPGFGSGAEVFSVEFSPDGETLATAGHGGVKLWDVGSWQERAKLSVESAANAAAFSPDGESVAVAERLNRLRLFDLATGREQAVVHAEMGPLYDVAFSLDGKSVAATGEGGAKLWDVITRGERVTLQEKGRLWGHWGAVGRVTYSPDRKLLATASRFAQNGVVILWDVPLLQRRAILRDTNVCAFSPDGQTLVTGGGENVNGEVICKLEQWDIADLIKPEVLTRQTKAAAAEFIEALRTSGFERAAGNALAAFAGHEAALPVLLDGLDDPNVQIHKGILFALKTMGPKAIPALQKALKDENPSVRSAAAMSLSIIHQPESKR